MRRLVFHVVFKQKKKHELTKLDEKDVALNFPTESWISIWVAAKACKVIGDMASGSLGGDDLTNVKLTGHTHALIGATEVVAEAGAEGSNDGVVEGANKGPTEQ